MNKQLEKRVKAAAKEFAGKKKAPTTPEKQFEKGAIWLYNFLMNGEAVDMYREQFQQDVLAREGIEEVPVWKESLIDELAEMKAEKDAMMIDIRIEGRLIEKYDKQMNPYKESNPLYVHVKAKEQSISVWRDKLGLSNTVNPERIKQSAKKVDENDPTRKIDEFIDSING